MSKQMPPKVISGGDNPYDIHDAKLSSSATAHESSSVTAHEISNIFTATTLDLEHILSINDTAIPDPQPFWGADFMFSVAHLFTASFVLV